jgi:hypothetical protein
VEEEVEEGKCSRQDLRRRWRLLLLLLRSLTKFVRPPEKDPQRQ